MNKKSDQPLQCKVIGNRLVISMGIDGIECFRKALKETHEWPKQAGRITNKREFCEDVAQELIKEDSIGTTLITEFINQAVLNAANNGSGHINWLRK